VIFTPTDVAGAFVIELERHGDARGFFARTFCREEFNRQGLDPVVVQASLSFTPRSGTLRGLHYQRAPHEESKVVRCVRGRIHDVVLDLRATSPTYLHHVGLELDDRNRLAIYVPAGCAHGFQTLTDDVEIAYQMSAAYAPHAQAGVRWNDPAFGIDWPIAPVVMNERDRTFLDFVR